MNTFRQYKENNNVKVKSMEKLGSGLRINRSCDDAAGLSISEKMRGQLRGLNKASQNVQDGFGLIQTAEGGLGETADILQRMRELAVQAANPTNVVTEREAVQIEVDKLVDEIDRIANATEYNTRKLLNGDQAGANGFHLQVGANEGQTMVVDIDDMRADKLGMRTAGVAISLGDQDQATAALTLIDGAIKKVSDQRSHLGAYQNRLELTLKGLELSSGNLQSAESYIRDTDMAKEMINYTGKYVQENAAEVMSSQANQLPERVLEILRAMS